jgi:hypothetical protein
MVCARRSRPMIASVARASAVRVRDKALAIAPSLIARPNSSAISVPSRS